MDLEAHFIFATNAFAKCFHNKDHQCTLCLISDRSLISADVCEKLFLLIMLIDVLYAYLRLCQRNRKGVYLMIFEH